MTDGVMNEVDAIQLRAELDRLLDNFDYVYGRYRSLFGDEALSEATRTRIMDYVWTTLVQARVFEPNKPAERIVVMGHDEHE